MKKEDFNLDSTVTVKMPGGSTKDGILKGVNEDCNGNVQATVAYLETTMTPFNLEDVTLK